MKFMYGQRLWFHHETKLQWNKQKSLSFYIYPGPKSDQAGRNNQMWNLRIQVKFVFLLALGYNLVSFQLHFENKAYT